MTLLKRHLAPFGEDVWKFIDDEAVDVLKQKLNARKVVDVVGPRGKDYASYNTGRISELDINDDKAQYNIRKVLPLVEVKIPFSIDKNEIEALLRGAEDVDVDNLVKACEKTASIENNAVFYGMDKAGISGLAELTEQEKINMNEETGVILPISTAVQAMKSENVEGPYNLLIGPYVYSLLASLDGKSGYPLRRKVGDLIEGNIIYSKELGEQSILLGNRDDDFEMILGQDISIGYKGYEDDQIELFLAESFTFNVNAPEAVIVFEK